MSTAERFDAVLLHAPCSATGVFRRHPDVLHLKGSRDLAPVLALQAALLDRALTLLALGGRMVYPTCSLDPREGEAQLASLQARMPTLRVDPVWADEVAAGTNAYTSRLGADAAGAACGAGWARWVLRRVAARRVALLDSALIECLLGVVSSHRLWRYFRSARLAPATASKLEIDAPQPVSSAIR